MLIYLLECTVTTGHRNEITTKQASANDILQQQQQNVNILHLSTCSQQQQNVNILHLSTLFLHLSTCSQQQQQNVNILHLSTCSQQQHDSTTRKPDVRKQDGGRFFWRNSALGILFSSALKLPGLGQLCHYGNMPSIPHSTIDQRLAALFVMALFVRLLCLKWLCSLGCFVCDGLLFYVSPSATALFCMQLLCIQLFVFNCFVFNYFCFIVN